MDTEERTETRRPPAIVTVGVIAVALALWALTGDNTALAVVAGAVAVLCGVLWAFGNYLRDGR